MRSVGQVVRERREAMGWTLAALAEAVGATKGYLSMIENHRLDNPPSRRLLEALEWALGVTAGDLVRVADWQATPEPIRREVERLTNDAGRGRELAAWLKDNAAKRKKGGPGKDLDALYRSGQLSKRVNAVLDAPGSAPGSAPGISGAAAGELSGETLSGGGVETSGGGVRYRVPVINRVAAGEAQEHTDLGFPDGSADRYLDVPEAVTPDMFATEVTGDSMRPRYEPGDVVVFSGSAKVEDGCDCFVRLEPDHETTFKRVYFDHDAATIRLQPLNPDFPPRVVKREQVAGLYRAVGRYSKL
ncbi:MAG: LexA family transcriptional regulator [Planctomycetota bacterium]